MASGQGNQKAPQESPISASAPSAPAISSATERDRSSRLIDSPVGAVLGDQQPAGAVDDEAGAAEEDEHHEGDPQHERVDVEVTAEAAGDTGDLAVLDGTTEPAQVADLVAVDAGPGVGGRGLRLSGGGGGGGVLVMAPACARRRGHHRGTP